MILDLTLTELSLHTFVVSQTFVLVSVARYFSCLKSETNRQNCLFFHAKVLNSEILCIRYISILERWRPKKKKHPNTHSGVFNFPSTDFPCSILEISQINFNPTNLCSRLKCVKSRWKQCQVSKHEQDEKHELCRESEKWPVFIRRGLRRSVDARGDLVHFVYSKLYITSRSPQRRRCSSSIFPPLAPLSLLSFDLRFSSPQSHWQRRDVRLQEFTL